MSTRGIIWTAATCAREVLEQYPTVAVLGPLDRAGEEEEGERGGLELGLGLGLELLGEALHGLCCNNCNSARILRGKRDRMLEAVRVCAASPLLSERVRGATYERVKLVVFDLDGVLVDSQQLHFDALNQALEAVAGPRFVISPDDHQRVYNGLSTQQKLGSLNSKP